MEFKPLPTMNPHAIHSRGPVIANDAKARLQNREGFGGKLLRAEGRILGSILLLIGGYSDPVHAQAESNSDIKARIVQLLSERSRTIATCKFRVSGRNTHFREHFSRSGDPQLVPARDINTNNDFTFIADFLNKRIFLRHMKENYYLLDGNKYETDHVIVWNNGEVRALVMHEDQLGMPRHLKADASFGIERGNLSTYPLPSETWPIFNMTGRLCYNGAVISYGDIDKKLQSDQINSVTVYQAAGARIAKVETIPKTVTLKNMYRFSFDLGKECALLSQQFLIDDKPSYELKADMESKNGVYYPVTWTYDRFDAATGIRLLRGEFNVEAVEINSEVDAEFFDLRPEPGMKVKIRAMTDGFRGPRSDKTKVDYFYVNRDGTLRKPVLLSDAIYMFAVYFCIVFLVLLVLYNTVAFVKRSRSRAEEKSSLCPGQHPQPFTKPPSGRHT